MHRFHSDVLWGEYSEEDLKGYWAWCYGRHGWRSEAWFQGCPVLSCGRPSDLEATSKWNMMKHNETADRTGRFGKLMRVFCSRSRYFHLREIPWNSVPLLEGTSFVVSLGVMCFCLRTTRKRNGIRCLAHVAFSKIQHSSFFFVKMLIL